MGVIFVYPLRLLIVHQNNFPYFTVFHLLGPSINLHTYVGFDTPSCMINSFNEHFSLWFLINLVFGLLLDCVEFDTLGVPVIAISDQQFNSSCDSFISTSFYKLSTWMKHLTFKSIFVNLYPKVPGELITFPN